MVSARFKNGNPLGGGARFCNGHVTRRGKIVNKVTWMLRLVTMILVLMMMIIIIILMLTMPRVMDASLRDVTLQIRADNIEQTKNAAACKLRQAKPRSHQPHDLLCECYNMGHGGYGSCIVAHELWRDFALRML